MTANLYEKNERYHVMLNWYQDEKRKQKSVTTGILVKGNNKRKAEARKNDVLREWEVKILKKDESILFADHLKSWILDSKKRVQPTTFDVYEHLLEKHLYPYFIKLGIELQKVTSDIIQQYYSCKINEGLSSNTVIKHHAVMRTALQNAYKSKLITDNPCDFADKPKRTKFRGEFYNADEIKTLLEIAKGTPLETVIFITAHFGLRRSEIIGLKWNAIDFDNHTLTIKHKVVRMKENGKLINYATDELKNESSYRVLPLDDYLISYLKNLKHIQSQNRERNGNSHNNEYNDYICVNGIGDLINPDYVTGYFSKIIKRNNLKHIRFHDLRHSCASLLLALGYSMKDIQEWLGHSNYLTTANLYSHVDPRNKKNMIKGLSSALSI